MRCLLFLIMLVVTLNPAAAGTFCLAGIGISPQCIYEDVRDCRRAADTDTMNCTVNPDAALMYIGGMRYCMVGSERVAECLHADRRQCNAEAARSRRVCFDRAIMDEGEESPYRYDQRIQR